MSHGSSPAAWTAVTVALVGFLVAAISFIPHHNFVILAVGAVIVAISPIVGKVMSGAGLGVKH